MLYLRTIVETVDVALVLVAKVLGGVKVLELAAFNLQPFEIDFDVLEAAMLEVLEDTTELDMTS